MALRETHIIKAKSGKIGARVVGIIPAHNEERFIGSVVLKARQFMDKVIVIDDGSTDATAEIAAAAGACVVSHSANQGKGQALNCGFAKALEFNPQVVVTIDGDWQHMPEEIPIVTGPILKGQADIVVGSRYLDSKSDVPFQRVLGHKGFNSLIGTLSGVSITDSQSGFRAFSPEVLHHINFHSRSFSVEAEMQFLAQDYKLRMLEVPITIRYLDKPKRSVIKHGVIVLNGIIGLVSQHRPLLFFSVSGCVILLLGLLTGAWLIQNYQANHQLPMSVALVNALMLILGICSIFTGILLHALRSLRLEIKGVVRQ